MTETVFGVTKGLSADRMEQLQSLYHYRVEREDLISEELLGLMAKLSFEINRETAVYLNRRGQVVAVSVGDSSTVPLPAVNGRRGVGRLSGIRCLHTHPGASGELSRVDLMALKAERLDLMAAIGVSEGQPTEIYIGYIAGGPGERFMIEGPVTPDQVNKKNIMSTIAQMESWLEREVPAEDQRSPETAVLVGLASKGADRGSAEELLVELGLLAETAGAQVCAQVVQQKDRPDSAYYIGQGKAKEIELLSQAAGADLVIFDDELSPAQLRNLEQIISARLIDRTALILDIFAQRARSAEGKIQVELAQLKYILPRLAGKGNVLSRLGGGIGTRGPGETKLETERRHIRHRISILDRELDEIVRRRSLFREQREASRLPVLALVGYTNAGKSTLLNTLTGASVPAEDRLFATLDPTARRLTLPDGRDTLLTDTVGFVRKLPHQLVAAFRATLEEVKFADVLVHVVDSSHPGAEKQVSAVIDVLHHLGAAEKPIITVFNKIDRKPEGLDPIPRLREELPHVVDVSAVTGEGLDGLKQMMARVLPGVRELVTLAVPYHDAHIVSFIHDRGRVLESIYEGDRILVTAELDRPSVDQLAGYIVAGGGRSH